MFAELDHLSWIPCAYSPSFLRSGYDGSGANNSSFTDLDAGTEKDLCADPCVCTNINGLSN